MPIHKLEDVAKSVGVKLWTDATPPAFLFAVLVEPDWRRELLADNVEDMTLLRSRDPIITERPSHFLNDDMTKKLRALAIDVAKAAVVNNKNSVIFGLSADFEIYLFDIRNDDDSLSRIVFKGSSAPWLVSAYVQAQNPFQSFTPSRGTLSKLALQGEHPNVHFQVYANAGDTIAPDGRALARLIGYGEDRGQAVKALSYALDSLEIIGVASTAPFLSNILAHDCFERGDYDSRFYAQEYGQGFDVVDLGIGHSRHIAAICAIMCARVQGLKALSLWRARVNQYEFTIELEPQGRAILAAIDEDSDKATVEIEVTTDWGAPERVAAMIIDGREMVIQADLTDEGYRVSYRGGQLDVALELCGGEDVSI